MFQSPKQFIDQVISNAVATTKDDKKALAHINTANAFLYHHYALLTLAIGSIVTLAIVVSANVSMTIPVSLLCIITLGLIIVCFSISSRLSQKDQLNIRSLHHYLLAISAFMGLSLSIGTGIITAYYGLPVSTPHHMQVGCAAFVTIMMLVSIASLSHRLHYLVIFASTSLSYFFFKLSQEADVLLTVPYFYLYALIMIAVYGIIAFEENRRRRHISKLLLLGWQSKQKITRLQKNIQTNEIALLEETKARQIVETELHEAQTMVDQTVMQRTKKIADKNETLTISKRNLEVANEAAGIASWNWNITEGLLTGENFSSLLDYNDAEIPTLLNNLFSLVHPEDEAYLREEIDHFLTSNCSRFSVTFRVKNKHGEWMWLEAVGTTTETTLTNKPAQMAGVVRDITLEKNVMDSLNLSNKVFEQSAESIFVLDAQLKYISVNPSYEQVMGYNLEELEGQPLFLWHDNIIATNNNIRKIVHTLKNTGQYSGEISEKNKNGERVYLKVSLNAVKEDDSDDISNYIGVFSDLTQQTVDKQKLSYLENYDQLTDLPNRRFYNQQLHSMLTNNKEKFSVIRINIDRFSVLNNSLGNHNGDLLLKQVSERMSRMKFSVRALARIGGDDFAVLYNHLSLHDLKKYLNALYKEFEEPFFIGKQELNVGLSVGISLYPQHGHQVDTLISRAEQGLKRAKENGGNDFFIYNQGLHVSSENFIELETQLRHAISKGELVAFYQPKVALTTNNVIGFEALVRWNHPSKGLLLPGTFMEVAEETGLINYIGNEMLALACKQVAYWQKHKNIESTKVAVNVEAQQLKRGNFLAKLDNIIKITGIDPRDLEIEITESSLMDMPDKILPLLKEIKQRNITIAMDDFGTGYSSLAYLSQYPIDVIKIDQSFVKNLNTSNESAGIVRAIIAMGHSLGMKLVAEGVETKEQISFLKQEGCHIAQGFYYGKAVPHSQATQLLEHSSF